MAKKTKQEQGKTILVFVIAILALAGVMILFSLAKDSFYTAVSDTQDGYEQASKTLSGQLTSQNTETRSQNLIPGVLSTDPVRQEGTAPVVLTIIEYGDFECSFCADMSLVLSQVLREYDSVRLVWKDLANPGHFQARPAAHAARCAQEQGAFWEYHDYLFTNQEQLGQDLYIDIAAELGLDQDAFETCQNQGTYTHLIDRGLDEASTFGVDGTPYLFVGSTRVDQQVDIQTLREIVERELQK